MDVSRFAQTFREEARELLARIESLLVELERAPGEGDTVHQIFRALHTIKGSGSMFGYTALPAFAHEFEALFDRMRKGELAVSKPIIDLTLSACDHLHRMLEDESSVAPEDSKRLVDAIRSTVSAPGASSSAAPPAASAPAGKAESAKEEAFLIHFRPHDDLFLRGTNPLVLLRELHALGECHVAAVSDEDELESLDPERCRTAWCLALKTSRGLNAVKDVFIFVEDCAEVRIEPLDAEDTADDGVRRIGDILLERGALTKDALHAILAEHKRFGQIAVEKGLVKGQQVAEALSEQEVMKALHDKRRVDEAQASIRVARAKVDALVDMVGELVTLQSRFRQVSIRKGDVDFRSLSEALDRLTDSLRDTAMGMRMIPIAETFQGFQRMVRDLSHELGKEVSLVLQGTETELDKNVIDSLKDPLLHILRNAVDHGIETPERRAAAGKPSRGTITLAAAYEGAHVLISVEDDGGGLDPARIRAKAIEKGLIQADAALSDAQAIQLIFLPGFSTAAQATNVSGRGVGMDVVKKNVERLRGNVDVSFKPNAGTRMCIRIPLTLAIIDGLLARIGGDAYILNLSSVDECVDLTPDILATGNGSDVVALRGELVPFVRLREHFGIGGPRAAIERMVVARIAGMRLGLVVDDVVGQHQAVIKPLGSAFGGQAELAGASILGDGTVALILDVNAIARSVGSADRGTAVDGSQRSAASPESASATIHGPPVGNP